LALQKKKFIDGYAENRPEKPTSNAKTFKEKGQRPYRSAVGFLQEPQRIGPLT